METKCIESTLHGYTAEEIMQLLDKKKVKELFTPTAEEIKKSFLAYIEPLEEYTTIFYKGKLVELCANIFDNKRFGYSFFLTTYKQHELNRYKTFNLICFMKEKSVFRNNISARVLCCCLERGINKEFRRIYANMRNIVYSLDSYQCEEVEKIIDGYKTN